MKKLTIKTGIILLSLFFVALGSFAQKFEDAIDYNDYIVNEQFAIVEKMEIWSNSISELAEKDVVLEQLDEIIVQIEASIKKVRKMKENEGNTAFRDAALDLFRIYKRICENEYRELVDILYAEDIGEEELERMNEIIDKVTEEETEKDDNFITAQKEFADVNDFILN